MPRRRSSDDDERIDLGAPEHAWWAGTPTDPFAAPDPAADRTGSAPGGAPTEADVPGGTADGTDPYKVLRVDPHAEWDDVVASYRRLARWWHPDGLGEATDVEREACELRIRELNEAYHAIRVRRGR